VYVKSLINAGVRRNTDIIIDSNSIIDSVFLPITVDIAIAPQNFPIAEGIPKSTLTEPAPADSPMIVI
jgi:ABC-type uncharacterized transport system involved in gliding motility auxiliary subunit